MKSNRGNKWTQILLVVLSLILIASMILGFVATVYR
jgi:Na+-transporting NADH:ubiquinone oxidoreductase subunit NqrC